MTRPGEDNKGIEFRVSEMLDGQLGEVERAKIEGDALAKATAEDYRAVDGLVEAWSRDVPEVDWSAFEREAAERRAGVYRRDRLRFAIRLFAPVAAAAAIVLTFITMDWPVRTNNGVIDTVTQAYEVEVSVSRPEESEFEEGSMVSVVRYGPADGERVVESRAESATVVIAYASVGGGDGMWGSRW